MPAAAGAVTRPSWQRAIVLTPRPGKQANLSINHGETLAGTGVPGAIDNTFGPERVFVKGSTRELGANLSPAYGMQFFGHIAIDGESGAMTVCLKDVADSTLWSRTLEPVRT